jgi:hypothetical protein
MRNVRVTVIFRLIVVTAAAAVAAGLSSCSSGRGVARNDSQLSGIIGLRWRIVEVRHDAVSVAIPGRRGGYFALSADGALLADDTLNNYAAHFRTTRTGFHVTDSIGSGVGYAGRDPMMLTLIEGTQVLTNEGADVSERLVGNQLDLSVGRYRITAVRAGSVGAQPSPSPSPTNRRS